VQLVRWQSQPPLPVQQLLQILASGSRCWAARVAHHRTCHTILRLLSSFSRLMLALTAMRQLLARADCFTAQPRQCRASGLHLSAHHPPHSMAAGQAAPHLSLVDMGRML
jgi:hypothetical protein